MSENVFTRKLGPLPGWAWAALAVTTIAVGQRIASNKASTLGVDQGATASGQSGTVPTGLTSINYPASTVGYNGYGQSSNDLAGLESLLTVLAAQGSAAAPSPGNAPAPAVTPGNTGQPAIQVQPDVNILPKINSANFTIQGANGESFDVLGSFTGAGGQFTGYNVGGGVPVYAYQNGVWMQNYNTKALPVGTQLGIPSTFRDYIDRKSGVVTETL